MFVVSEPRTSCSHRYVACGHFGLEPTSRLRNLWYHFLHVTLLLLAGIE